MTMANGLNQASRRYYEPLRAWFVGGSFGYTYGLSSRDSFSSSLSLMKTWSSNDNEVASANVSEVWAHRFGRRTGSWLGAGLSLTRFSQADGLAGVSVFPTFQLGVAHQATLGRGTLTFSASTYSSPVLDPLRALVDPQVGVSGGIDYARKKLSLGVSGNTSISVAPSGNDAGAVNSTQGQASVGYQLGELVQIDAGGRLAARSYQGNTEIPPSWAAFVGISFGYHLALTGRR
jgi:hypothetical protein